MGRVEVGHDLASLVIDYTTSIMAFGQDERESKILTFVMIGCSVEHLRLWYGSWKQLWPAHRPSPATGATKGLTVHTYDSVVLRMLYKRFNSFLQFFH